MDNHSKPFGLTKTLSLRTRLLIAFILTVLLPVIIMSVSSAILGFRDGQNQVRSRLEAIAVLKEAELDLWLDGLKNLFTTLVAAHDITQLVQHLPLEPNKKAQVYEHFISFLQANPSFDELFILDLEGKVVLSTEISQENKIYKTEPYFIMGQQKLYIDAPFYDESLANNVIIMTQPLFNEQGQRVGVFAARVNLNTLNEIMQRLVGLGETGETYLVTLDYVQLTKSRFITHTVLVQTLGADQALVNHANGVASYNDYRNVPVIGAYRWLPNLQVALLSEQDQAEALAPLYQTLRVNLSVALLALLFAIFASLLLTRNITRPIINLAETAHLVAEGDLTQVANITRHDEIGYLAETFNRMTQQLRGLIGGLEERISNRTHQLETMVALGERLISLLQLDELLTVLVQEIQTRFNYQQVNIYVVDEFHQILVKHGEAERNEHTLSLETQANLLVQAVLRQEVKLVNQELLLPIILEQRVLALLQIQSPQLTHLELAEITLLRSLANQAAVAIHNARLFAQLEQALVEAREIQTQYLQQAWRQDTLSLQHGPYKHSQPQARPLSETLIAEARQHLDENARPQLLTLTEAGEQWQSVIAPVTFRHMTIGMMQLHARPDTLWKEDDMAIIEAVVDQLGQIAERLRLFENTRQRATNEQIIREITDKLRAAPNLNRLMEIATVELGQHLGATHANIELGFENKQVS